MTASPSLSRRRLLAFGAVGAASAAAAHLPAPAVFADELLGGGQRSTPAATVSATPAQTMQGFGAAGAWWPNDLITFPPAVQETVADMLFGEEGIALSVYRYNIGGGGVGVTNSARAPETFLVAPGRYDWNRGAGGRRFLTLAAERRVPNLIGFVNSAPSIWTTNGESRGGYLLPGSEAAYAEYLVDVVAHFRETEGISLAYLSAMNEPDHRFSDGGQEGMGVPVEQRATVVQTLGQELAARAPYCRVIADESSRVSNQFIQEASRWLSVPGTTDYLAALAHHRYDFPNDITLRLARELAERYSKPLWCTEICCFDSRTGTFGQQYDPSIRSALMMANLIWQGLTVANDAAFHWWVACSSEMGCDPVADPAAAAEVNDEGWNDGLLYYDPNYPENGNRQIYPTKRYYALGNFSRYVRPGDQRHDVTGAPLNLHVMAFATASAGQPAAAGPDRPAGTVAAPAAQRPATPAVRQPAGGSMGMARWSVVVVNNAPDGATTTTLNLRLPLPEPAWLSASVAVETSADRNLEPVALPRVGTSGTLSMEVPPQSITTYVLHLSDRP